MKPSRPTGTQPTLWCAAMLAAGLTLSSQAAEPAEKEKPATAEKESASEAETAPEKAALTPEQMFEGGEKTYNNWVELGVGGFFTEGNEGQFQQNHQNSGTLFGGIQDLHYQTDVVKGTTLALDGRALFEEDDYKLDLKLVREKLGYVRFSYDQFRTWYNGDGGYYAPLDLPFNLSGDALALDRGEVSFEAGLTAANVPQIVFRYTHSFREGEKNSTIWGMTHPTLDTPVRGLSPTINAIDERRDTVEVDASHRIKATDFGLGVRFETAKLDNTLKINQWPGEPVEQHIDDTKSTSYDLFNIHAFTETWMKNKSVLSSGFSYTQIDSDFTGSRVYEAGPNPQPGLGYYGLNGGSRLNEYVGNLNFMAKPTPHFSIVPSLRVQQESIDSSSTGTETLGTATPVPFGAQGERSVLDVRERLDLTYSGLSNWVFFARGELAQGQGDLEESGGLVPVNGVGVPAVMRETDDSRFFQKYGLGARWYPARAVAVDAGGYYKLNQYEYDHLADSTPNTSFNRYPAYLQTQDFETYDADVRVTLKPRRNLSIVPRYEYQISTIRTAPDSAAGLGEVETSSMTSHIVALDVNYSPWTRLYLQLGINVVLSETETPTSDYTQAVLDAQNNYWTLNFNTGIVLDDKTDLRLGYVYYQSDNFEDNSLEGLPLGMSAEQHAVTALLTRRLTERIRLNLRYGYYRYNDETFGDSRDYQAHLVYSSLQYRF